MKHVQEADLALFATGDLPALRRAQVWLHQRGCESCHAKVLAYRADRRKRLVHANELPEGLDWERLAAEMTANIHVGLAAGECVAPRRGSRLAQRLAWKDSGTWTLAWRPAAVVLGLLVVLSAAWYLNVPQGDTEALGRVMHGILHGGRRSNLPPTLAEESGPVVEATASGVQIRENGGALGVSENGLHPLTVSVSVQGSASAHYIDTDTGQMTITSVYAQ